MKKGIVFLLPLLFLSSCLTPYNSSFTCSQMGTGVCDSIPNVYERYKQGEFSERKTKELEKGQGVIYYKKCVEKTVCKQAKKDCFSITKDYMKKKTKCERIFFCEPDSVTNHIDYRAKSVKDNAPEVIR